MSPNAPTPPDAHPDKRRIKAPVSYALLWCAALTGIVFGLFALLKG